MKEVQAWSIGGKSINVDVAEPDNMAGDRALLGRHALGCVGIKTTKLGEALSVVGRKTLSPQASTVVGSQSRLKGDLVFNESAELHGFIEGSIVSDGELTLGASAEVRAEIRGRVVIVLGKVIGDIRCTELLELKAGAKVSGNISAPRVMMHDGVQFDGSCRMGQECFDAVSV